MVRGHFEDAALTSAVSTSPNGPHLGPARGLGFRKIGRHRPPHYGTSCAPNRHVLEDQGVSSSGTATTQSRASPTGQEAHQLGRQGASAAGSGPRDPRFHAPVEAPVRADFYTPFAPPKIARTPSAPHNQGYQRSRADTSRHATPSEKHASDQGLLLEILVRERRGWDLNPR